MSLSDKQWEFLQDVARLILFAQLHGLKLTGGELLRTPYQQKKYLEDGLSKTMNSRHLKKLAIDLTLFVDGQPMWEHCPEWEMLGEYWESLHPDNKWGGHFKSFKDYPHFERN